MRCGDQIDSFSPSSCASQPDAFTLTVRNDGPAAAANSTVVTITLPALASGGAWGWTCSASGGATCPVSGTGNISATLTSFPSGGIAAFTIHSTEPSLEAWAATAAATVPVGITDTNADNNSATARSYVVMVPTVRR